MALNTYDIPTGAAESCTLEFDGGDVGMLKLSPETKAARPKSNTEMGRGAVMIF